MNIKPKILIIEDNEEIQILMERSLQSAYNVTLAKNANEAYEKINGNQYDLILLDVGLPGDNGYTVCAKIRTIESYKLTPVIFVTGNSALNDRLTGFSVGADDYILKPINGLELKARVDARMKNVMDSAQKREFKKFDDLCINYITQRVFMEDSKGVTDIDLTRVEFKLLVFLSDHLDTVVSREQILKAIWSNNVNVNDRTVDTHVSKLRKKITGCGFKINSIHGTGYRMVKESESARAA